MGKNTKFRIDPREYQEIMRGVELVEIKYGSFSAELLRRSGSKALSVAVEDEATVEIDGASALISQKYVLKAREEKAKSPSLVAEVNFTVAIKSETPLTQEFMDVYVALNLPLNTWPYFREFVASTVARFGMPPLTLPFRKN